MIGGLLKSTSLAALVAAAGLMAAGATAQAADLGGNCCADLEERIAELEATTARKGNRKVSLTVSGQVNEAVMFWDDGVESNAYVTTNEVSRTRFRFLGSAKIDSKWTAGYLLEIGVRGNQNNLLSQNIASAGRALDVRHSAWYLQHADLGKVWLGQTGQATESITEINLANVGHFMGPQQFENNMGAFRLRSGAGALSNGQINTVFSGGDNRVNPGEGSRLNVVKYETPTLAGFIGSASWGEDDALDIALRYAGEISGFKLAAGIGYEWYNDGTTNARRCAVRNGGVATLGNVDCNQFGLSASIMHVPTGLFVTGAYGFKEDSFRVNGKDDDFFHVMGGIEQTFFPLGKSTLYGVYQEGNQNAQGQAGYAAGQVGPVALQSADYTQWGIGFNQNIANAAMDVYIAYNNYSFDIKDVTGAKLNVNDIDMVIAGARIQF